MRQYPESGLIIQCDKKVMFCCEHKEKLGAERKEAKELRKAQSEWDAIRDLPEAEQLAVHKRIQNQANKKRRKGPKRSRNQLEEPPPKRQARREQQIRNQLRAASIPKPTSMAGYMVCSNGIALQSDLKNATLHSLSSSANKFIGPMASTKVNGF